MKSKFILPVIIGLLILSLGIVSAEDGVANQDVSAVTIFWNNLIHNFNSGTFSVVGTNQQCGLSGGVPNYEWAVGANQNFMTGTLDTSLGTTNNRPSSLCSNPIIDIFTHGWTPFIEVKSLGTSTYNSCSSTSAPCVIQVYCCPKAEPSSQSDCSGGTFNHITCTKTSSSYTSYWCPTESGIPYFYPSYNYCSSVSSHRCYYKISGATSCANTYYDYQGVTSCSQVGSPLGYYNGHQLFESQSSCDASNSCQNSCSPNSKQCSGNGYQTCVIQSNGCYNWNSVTSCSSGQTCSNGVCSVQEPSATCSDGIQNQGETGIDCGGSCSSCEVTPESKKCSDFNGACGLTCNSNIDTQLGTLGSYDCNFLQICCIPKCPSGTTRCSDNSCKADCSGTTTNQTTGELICKNDEQTFYVNAQAKTSNKIWLIIPIAASSSSGDVINANGVNTIIPGFSTKYFDTTGSACCSGTKPVFVDSKTFETSSWALIGSGTNTVITYDLYKCSSTETQGFCINVAQSWLGNITKSDCQTNTIILGVLIILGLIVIARFMG